MLSPPLMNTVEITSEKIGDILCVYLKGSALDASNVSRFRHETAHLFQDNANFVFELGGLEFVDSSGIGALLSCLRKAHSAGGNVKIAALQSGVRSLFELVRMNRLFEIFETKDDALASFRD